MKTTTKMNAPSMMNWKMWAYIVMWTYLLVTVTVLLFMQNTHEVAYVNSGTLFTKYKGAIEASKKLETESKKWQDNIKTLQTELDSLNFMFANQSDKWSLNKKREMATYARKKDEEMKKYSEAVQQNAVNRQQELLTPVLADINNAVGDYAKKHGYKIVLGTTDGNIVYAEKAIDITEDVLKILNGTN